MVYLSMNILQFEKKSITYNIDCITEGDSLPKMNNSSYMPEDNKY